MVFLTLPAMESLNLTVSQDVLLSVGGQILPDLQAELALHKTDKLYVK